VCDFLRGTTHFYSVSEVQIHAWFRPTATRGSQRGYKYDLACVAKAFLFHAWVVLITTGVLYQLHVSIVIITWASFSYNLDINKEHTYDCCMRYSYTVLLFVLQCLYSNSRAWTNLVQAKWPAWLTLDNAWPQMHHSTASDALGFITSLADTSIPCSLINFSHNWSQIENTIMSYIVLFWLSKASDM